MQAWRHLRFERVSETGGDIGVLLPNTHDHREAPCAFAARRPPEYHNV